MSHVTDPMMHLKQIYKNTLALTNQSFEFNTSIYQSDEEIQKFEDETIIKKFYEEITDETLTSAQNDKLNYILNDFLNGGDA